MGTNERIKIIREIQVNLERIEAMVKNGERDEADKLAAYNLGLTKALNILTEER